jgi:tetratricopeptide (TPR) repeat protein
MSPDITESDGSRSAIDWVEEGNDLYDRDRYAEIVICFDMAIEVDPEFPKAWYNKGVALGKLGLHDLALDCYDRTAELHPDRSDVWNNHGAALGLLGMYDEALTSFDRAIDLDQKNAEA